MSEIHVNLTLPDDDEVTAVALERFRAENAQLEVRRRIDEAQLRKMEIETNAQAIATRVIEADAKRAELATEEATIGHERELARDIMNHVFRFSFQVSDKTVGTTIEELAIWDRLDPTCSIEMVINSHGGEVTSGMELFDYLQELKRKGHTIITATRGMAASMGGVLLQAGLATPESPDSKRIAGRESYVLIHEASTLAIGKTFELEDEVAFVKKMQERILAIFVTGSAYAYEHGTSEVALTRDQFEHGDRSIDGVLGWARRDWWLDSDESLRFGVVDEVR